MSMLVKSCSFCNRPIAKGSGTMLAKNDGLVLKRDPRKLKWTKKYVKGGIKVKK